jgi:salicylate hydroxylase
MAQTPQDLKIAIIGAGVLTLYLSRIPQKPVLTMTGMGGLTCALALAKEGFKHIDVFEYAADLGFVGAGIQLAPNMARVLDRLGVWKDIEAEAVEIKDTSVRGMT